MTNIRCQGWLCYWEQQFGEPMGTYLAHHWVVSKTVVMYKRIPVWGWVFEFFVIPMYYEYLKKKTE
jgi:hypothetical protein